MHETLLSDNDPAPFELVNPAGAAPIVLTCEHAGQAVPTRLGDLGVATSDMARHIGWDIGAEALAHHLAEALDAPLVVQRYSRLVVDCNRPLHAPSCIPEHSDGTAVPANHGLSQAARSQRYAEIHAPFHAAIAGLLSERTPSLLLPVHSFTPSMQGVDRPWHMGLLHGDDQRAAVALMQALGAAAPGFQLAFNEPYRVDHESDYTVPVHGEGTGVAHVLLEVRNDLLASAQAIAGMGELLTAAVRECVAQLEAA